jgi:hypothetical protein
MLAGRKMKTAGARRDLDLGSAPSRGYLGTTGADHFTGNRGTARDLKGIGGLVKSTIALTKRFSAACAALAITLEMRPGGPFVGWSPADLQTAWSDSCRLAGIDEVIATVLLNREPWPACFPADSRLLLISVVTDFALIIDRFGASDWYE